jgi:pimeloyl-ACP methyl ester carboxylesterase
MSIETVRSADGTSIAFETTGKGPALVLIGGAFCDRSAPTSGTPLAALLAHRFTVFSYDRRARGDSTDTAPWSLEREIEDIGAILEAAGGSAAVFGNSSGGLLALDAAARGLSISRLALYEPPVILDPERARSFEALATELDDAVANHRRADAVELYFTKVMQMPAGVVTNMRRSPMWSGLEHIAHTLGHDLRITASGPARLDRASSVRAETLVMSGGASAGWMRDALQTLAQAIPSGRHETLEGQTHAVDPKALASAIEAFLVG